MNTVRLVALALATPLAAQLTEVAEIHDPSPKKEDHFGWSVALSGDRLLVGAPRDDSGSVNGGAAFIFERQPDGAWTLVATLLPDNSTDADGFGLAVALDGDRALVGAKDALEQPSIVPGQPGPMLGAAYVFERAPSGVWDQVAMLTPSTFPTSSAEFGVTVALDGDRALIGDPFDNGLDGAAFVFERGPSGSWNEVAALQAGQPNAVLGVDLALDGDRALVLAPLKATAYVFERQPGGAWLDVAQLPAAFSSSSAMCLQGDRALVAEQGSAVVWERQPGGAWSSVAQLATVSGGNDFSAALDGDRIVIGDHSANTTGAFSGAALVFERTPGGTWPLTELVIPAGNLAGDRFGIDVALEGDRLVAGAAFDNAPVVEAGAANVFDLEPLSVSTDEISLSAGGSAALSVEAGGIAPVGDLYIVLGSVTGTAPGVVAPGGLVLPVNVDAYFLHTLNHPGAAPLTGSFGPLSSSGSATAVFALPGGAYPGLAGTTVHHAFARIDSAKLTATFTSNAAAIQLVP